MAQIMSGQQGIERLCKVFGIEGAVNKIVIEAEAGDIVKVYIKRFMTYEELEGLEGFTAEVIQEVEEVTVSEKGEVQINEA